MGLNRTGQQAAGFLSSTRRRSRASFTTSSWRSWRPWRESFFHVFFNAFALENTARRILTYGIPYFYENNY